jgi:ligand-binding sensor domain-containing protein
MTAQGIRLSKFAIPTLIFIYITISGFAQSLKFDHLTDKQGLSQNNVVDICQDKLGFIWVGTEDGLNFYDGYNFTIFRNNPKDPYSISNNNIHCVRTNKNGDLWVGTQAGVNRYDRDLNRFERFVADEKPGSLSNNDAVSIYFDSNDNVWVSTSNGLDVYNPETKTFSYFFHDPNDPSSLADNTVKSVIEDERKRIWVATSGGLSMMNPDKKTFTNFYHDPQNPATLSSNKLTSFYLDRNNVLWIGSFDAGLNKLNAANNTFTRYEYNQADPTTVGNNYIYGMSENQAGELWIATDGALCQMDVKAGKFTRHLQIPGNQSGLSSSIVAKIFFDINDRMWVGTRFGGLNIYDKEKYGFRHFMFNTYEANCLNNNNVTNFFEDPDGNIWIATDGGSVNYYNRATGKFSNYLNTFTNNKILAIAKDTKGGMWLGMWAGGVNYFDLKTKKVKHYAFDPKNPRSLNDNNVFDILIDKNENVWIATWGNGLARYNPETDDFTRYVHDPSQKNSISPSPLGILMEDSSGKIWIGTEQRGLDVFDPATGEFKNFKPGTQPGELSGTSILSLMEDSNKKIWVGSHGSGLNVLDPETGIFKTYREADGLPNNSIMGILEDKDKNIWVSTNKGLSRLNTKEGTFKNFTESDGLQGDQYNRWAFTRLSTGELMFGGTNGFNLFDPANIKPNTFKPPVYITDFKLFNKDVPIGENEILKKNILITDNIKLSYFQNIFSFEFTALNYRQPEKNQYRYIMEGFQDEWIEAGTERKVSYTNLSPGDYVFRVAASNNDGLWNNEGASVKITIVPPFWKTLWFNTLIVLLIISAILAYIRYQKRKARQQQEDLQAIIEERTHALKLQNEEIMKKAEKEKVQNWISEGLAKISETISKHSGNLDMLANESLKNLSKYIEAQQAAMAIAIKDDPNDHHLKILAAYGGSKNLAINKRIELGSGMIGATYEDKEKKVLENIPADYIKVESGLGMANPETIILAPLKTEDGEIVGVIEFAFLNKVPDTVHQFLDKVCSVIALNIVTANLTHKTMMLLQNSKEQTEELRAQEEEMRQSMEELEATQEEFRRREQEYQRKITELELTLEGKSK